jgi:hypothetical protein
LGSGHPKGPRESIWQLQLQQNNKNYRKTNTAEPHSVELKSRAETNDQWAEMTPKSAFDKKSTGKVINK